MHGFAIGRIEGNRGFKFDKCAYGIPQPLYPPVGDGYAFPEAGGAQFLAGKKAIKYSMTGKAIIVFKNNSYLFQHPFFTAGIEGHQDIIQGQNFCYDSHDNQYKTG